MPILMSNEPVIKALLLDIQNRKWVDLRRDDLRQGLEIISVVIPTFTQEDIERILNTPAEDSENLALRRLYFE